MIVLVTGAAGFIGRHVTKSLLDNGHSVLAWDDYSNSINDTLYAFHHDIRSFDHGLAELDAVIHLAAMGSIARCEADKAEAYSRNVLGFDNMLAWAMKNKIPKFIYASSSSIYTSDSFYATTKMINELSARSVQSCELQTIGLRLFNIVGPGQRWDIQHRAFLPAVIASLFHELKLPLYNNGKNRRDFTPVSLVCDTILALINDKYAGDAIDVGLGRPTECNEIVDMVVSEMVSFGGRPRVNTKIIEKRERESDISLADTNKIKRLGIDLNKYSLKEAIRASVLFYAKKMSFL